MHVGKPDMGQPSGHRAHDIHASTREVPHFASHDGRNNGDQWPRKSGSEACTDEDNHNDND